jgi:IS5 family transposase
VEVPRQRNSREENERIKAGVVPVAWDENKSCHKDTDARWLTKNAEKYSGYKNHVKTDAGTVLITKYEVTTANVHDSVPLGKLLDESDRGKDLHADSAYTGEGIETIARTRPRILIEVRGENLATVDSLLADNGLKRIDIRTLLGRPGADGNYFYIP